MLKEKKINEKDIEDLFSIILSLKTKEDCNDFFADLCTVKEVENMASRIKAAKLLMENNTYNQIIDKTDISSATLSRISRCIQYGKGYKKFIKKV